MRSGMQQIRETALACYDGFSEEQKNKAFAIFEAMDSDCSGAVSRKEYEEFFGSSNRTSFEELDTDGNGGLDFEEFITLFYILMTAPAETTAPRYPKHFQSSEVVGVSFMQRTPSQSYELRSTSLAREKPSKSDEAKAGASQPISEPASRSDTYREIVLKAIEDFNTVLSFGSTITSVAKTAGICTIM